MLLSNYQPIVESCQPYLVATDLIRDQMATTPFVFPIPSQNILNPQHRNNAPFLHMVKRLDELTYAPVGMPMPNWVFYDCAVMPGAVFGLSRPAKSLEGWVRAVMDVPENYDGPVPVSMFIAIPMLKEDGWFLYTLCDINGIAPGAGPAGLSELSLVLGLKVFDIENLYGATQWRARKLKALCRLGALDLVTALTPAHSYRKTLTYRADILDERLQLVLSSPDIGWTNPIATHLLDVDDEEMLLQVQQEIEAGVHWQIVGPPIVRGAFTQVPARRERREGGTPWI